MDLMREETFGPVLAIQMVKNADEALALANDSRFALSASIWTALAWCLGILVVACIFASISYRRRIS